MSTTMRAQYIRFINSVMTPGRAGTQISKAFTSAAEVLSAPIDERMVEILVGPEWVLLRAMRRLPDGTAFLAERVTHASNVRDFEPADEPVEDKRPRKGEPKET